MDSLGLLRCRLMLPSAHVGHGACIMLTSAALRAVTARQVGNFHQSEVVFLSMHGVHTTVITLRSGTCSMPILSSELLQS